MIKKLELIEEWKKAYRFWSVRLSLIGSAILSAFFAFPEAMIDVWNSIPGDLKTYFPAEWAKWIPIAIIIAGVLARLFKQKKLINDETSSDSPRKD
jgi:hypothetical protein